MMTFKTILNLLKKLDIESTMIFNTIFRVLLDYDQKAFKKLGSASRLYIQIIYATRCVKTMQYKYWRGRKWYLSDHMTEDEIVKTVFAAVKMAVEHEVLENFKVNGKALFNPHVDYKELLKISDKEVVRKEVKTKKNDKRKSSVVKLQRRKQRQNIPGGLRKR